jgi:hypothetical protein
MVCLRAAQLRDVTRRKFLQAAGAAMVALGVSPPKAAVRPNARALTVRASEYVAWYDEAMTAIVAEERYVQRRTQPDDERLTRELISEIGWIRLPGLDDAIAVREVMQVDGQPTAQRGRLRRLLEGPDTQNRLSVTAILDESATHNVASGTLNINFPTFPLTYLRERFVDGSRWQLREADGGSRLIEFRERRRLTVVRTPAGEHLRAQGQYWFDEATGRVERCEVRVEGVHRTAALPERSPGVTTLPPAPGSSGSARASYNTAVTFQHDARLDLWVPTQMSDGFERRDGRITERVTGDATYSNYRRFQTSGRLVSPGR